MNRTEMEMRLYQAMATIELLSLKLAEAYEESDAPDGGKLALGVSGLGHAALMDISAVADQLKTLQQP